MSFSSIEKYYNPVEFKDIKAMYNVANYRSDDQMENFYHLTIIKIIKVLLLLGNNNNIIINTICFMRHFMYIV